MANPADQLCELRNPVLGPADRQASFAKPARRTVGELDLRTGLQRYGSAQQIMIATSSKRLVNSRF